MAKLDKARRSIEEAREKQLTQLNLSGNQLTELPPEIGQLFSARDAGHSNRPGKARTWRPGHIANPEPTG